MNDELERDVDEPGAEIRFYQTWIFKLAKGDAMLVLAALGGRPMSEERKAAARELGDRLTALRIKDQESNAEGNARLRENLEASTGRTVDEILRGSR